MVTQAPLMYEIIGSNPEPYRKVGSCTEPSPTVCIGFLCPQNYPLGYDLYSVESNVKPQTNKLNVQRNPEKNPIYPLFRHN